MVIVRTKPYLRDLKRIGASMADQEALEQALANNPNAGDVIPGTGGLRKIRFALGNKGKRGGARAIYALVIIESENVVALLKAYSKSTKSDISTSDIKSIKNIMRDLNNENAKNPSKKGDE